MATQVNFSELKQNVSMENLLGHYGLLDGMKRVKEDELVGLCPFHEETRGSFHVSTSENAWNCFGCDGKGNILDFVMAKESVGIRAAGLLIQEWFPGSPQSAPETPKRRERRPSAGTEPKTDGNPALTFELKNLDAKHPYLLEERGLDPKTVEEFGLGYCSWGLMKNRVVIPVHDEHGGLVAYAGRYPAEVVPEDEPKYLVPPNWQKSLVLFNYHRALEEAHDKREPQGSNKIGRAVVKKAGVRKGWDPLVQRPPQELDYFVPILQALRRLDWTATPRQITLTRFSTRVKAHDDPYWIQNSILC